ncbi:hypothetical protein PLICRDRAFT_664036, partial [Plicaturopsis crispa FD-325 SS-3]
RSGSIGQVQQRNNFGRIVEGASSRRRREPVVPKVYRRYVRMRTGVHLIRDLLPDGRQQRAALLSSHQQFLNTLGRTRLEYCNGDKQVCHVDVVAFPVSDRCQCRCTRIRHGASGADFARPGLYNGRRWLQDFSCNRYMYRSSLPKAFPIQSRFGADL